MEVVANVYVRSEDGRHSALLRPGHTVPHWADVTNPEALAPEPDPEPEPAPAPAPAPATPSTRTKQKATPAA